MGLVYIKTYGCQMNVHESEKLYAAFAKRGTGKAGRPEDADIIILNTCCVREGAETRVIGNLGLVKKLKERKPDLIVAICGCMSQQEAVAEKIHKRCPFVNIITGTYKLHELPDMAERVSRGEKYILDLEKDESIRCGVNEAERTDKVSAFVNIMYGCNNFCTYCIVPYVKGRERSRRADDVTDEIKRLIDGGYKEVTLLGQNVNSYRDGDTDFAKLLDRVSDLNGDYWIKFMTSHPKDLSDEVIHMIAAKPRLAKYIHLPLQSGSDRILALMNRKYDVSSYMRKTDLIRKLMPDAGLSSDIIVGFPTETEDDYLMTENAVKRVGYNNLFTFIYSKRTGTPAATMEGQVDEDVKKERIARLIEVQAKIAAERAAACVGKTYRALCDGKDGGSFTGKTSEDRVIVFDGNASVGEFVNVLVTSAKNSKLYGKAVN